MKKNRLLLSLIFALALVLGISALDSTKVSAASKPAVTKKKVTLYTNSDPYTIEFKNLADKATIKYKTSNKKVVTVSKKGVVTPVGAGKASVKATVKQNGKSYKLKTVFTVKEAKKTSAPTAAEYKKMAQALIKELDAKAEVYPYNVTIEGSSNVKEISNQEVLDRFIFNESKFSYSKSYLYITDMNLLRSYEEYMAMYPSITSIEFTYVTKYQNIIEIEMVMSVDSILFDDEYAVENAINSGDTSYLSSDELALYKKLSSLAKELKGKSEYATIKNIHDYLVLNTLYPSSYSGNAVHTVAYTLSEGKAVCDGYAKTFYFLCRMNGIDCIVVTGDATNSKGKTETHAWNKVKIKDKWYALDVTWDDPSPDEKGRVLYGYFLVTDEDMSKNHTPQNTNLPVAKSKDLGIIYDKYGDMTKLDSPAEVKKYMSSRIDEVLGKSYDLTFDFIYTRGDTSIDSTIADVLYSYHSKYGCGYSSIPENAGILGTAYTIRVFK